MHYEDQEIKDFFSYVESKSNNNIPTGAITSFSKVSMRELCDTIAKLCSSKLHFSLTYRKPCSILL